MYFEQFYLGCLAHASYMLGSQGEAVVVDPQRDVDLYLKAAEEHGLTIRHIFETHLHADFVSGHKELAARTGAKIYFGAQAGATFDHVRRSRRLRTALRQSSASRFSKLRDTLWRASAWWSPMMKSRSKPWAVLTGDTLFIGDVGRPDLSRTHSPEQLAGMLYDSLHNKLLKLPDAVLVYPAHGAGSLCGRNMRAERSSTIGTERLTNYALQNTEPGRIRHTADQQSAGTSRIFPAGCRDQSRRRPCALRLAGAEGNFACGTESYTGRGRDRSRYSARRSVCRRPRARFRQHSVCRDNSLHGRDRFSACQSRPVLIADTPEQLSEARLRLARVGIEAERGYLEGGVAGWKRAGFDLATLHEISVQELQQQLSANKIRCSMSAAKRSGWPGTLTEPHGGRSIASGFLLRRLISMFLWRSTARAAIAASLPAVFCNAPALRMS